MRHCLCIQEVAPAGSQQLRAQDPAPARRCDTKWRTGHQGREGRPDDRNRDKSEDWNESENGNGHEDRDGGGNGTGARTGTGTRMERSGTERESLAMVEVGPKT